VGGSESAPGYHYVKAREEGDPPVTAMATWRATPGRAAELERFIGSIVTEAMRFSGHLGTVALRPAEDGDRTYRVVFRFDHVSSLRRWERSEERRHWLQLAKDAGVADAAPDVDVVTGPETWFTLPGRRSIVPPPRVKIGGRVLDRDLPADHDRVLAFRPLACRVPAPPAGAGADGRSRPDHDLRGDAAGDLALARVALSDGRGRAARIASPGSHPPGQPRCVAAPPGARFWGEACRRQVAGLPRPRGPSVSRGRPARKGRPSQTP
jgi:hypothetical protein